MSTSPLETVSFLLLIRPLWGFFVLFFFLVSKSVLSFTLILLMWQYRRRDREVIFQNSAKRGAKTAGTAEHVIVTCSAHTLESSFLTAHVLVLEFRLLPSGSQV